jgi:hydrogenase maturation factor
MAVTAARADTEVVGGKSEFREKTSKTDRYGVPSDHAIGDTGADMSTVSAGLTPGEPIMLSEHRSAAALWIGGDDAGADFAQRSARARRPADGFPSPL